MAHGLRLGAALGRAHQDLGGLLCRGQSREGKSHRLHQLLQVATVPQVGQLLGRQPLAERVQVVISHLQGDDRLDRTAAVRARHRCRQRCGDLDVEALLAQLAQRQAAQRGVGNRAGTQLPALQLCAHGRRDGAPVADVREQQRKARPPGIRDATLPSPTH